MRLRLLYYKGRGQVKKRIGPLLVNISRTVEKMELKQRQRLSAMGKELNVDGF